MGHQELQTKEELAQELREAYAGTWVHGSLGASAFEAAGGCEELCFVKVSWLLKSREKTWQAVTSTGSPRGKLWDATDKPGDEIDSEK